MKKIWLIIIVLMLLSGCVLKKEQNVIKKMERKIKPSGYHLKGKMSIYNNEDVYKYNVDASFSKNNFRVSLFNTLNNHQQIILKNKNGVFALTPSLNKSFKFQSEWPHNNSQVYLLQSLIKDMKNDKSNRIRKEGNFIIASSKVDYPNNPNLLKQDIYFDKKINLSKVIVYDKKNKPAIEMVFSKIDYKATFKKNYFNLNNNMNVSKLYKKTEVTSKIDEVYYPMYVPQNASFDKEEKVSKVNGERVLMTFGGSEGFTLIEESANYESKMNVMQVDGDPVIMGDGVAAVSKRSVRWFTPKTEYYLISERLTKAVMLEVANSINVKMVGK